MGFEENVRLAIEKYKMLDGAECVYVGLSGGADSVSELLMMNDLKTQLGFEVKAVHVNHNLRGEESNRDELFCRELCGQLNIPIEVFSVEAGDFAAEKKLSTEEAARILRYEAFEKVIADSTTRLATAHTLCDNAETVLFNLARGTGIKGLCGIPPVRDRFIRPLIFCTRTDVEDFLARKNQNFVTDSTNLSDDCSRNITRHSIIPLMEQLHGGFYGNIRRMTENLAADCNFIDDCAEKSRDDDLRTLHSAVRKRIILKALAENNVDADAGCAERIDKALFENYKSKINVEKNTFVYTENGKITVEKIKYKEKFIPVQAKIGINRFLCDKNVIISENNCENIGYCGNINEKFTNDRLDCDKIQGVVTLRSRMNGDSFIRCGRSFTSSLKKLMNERYDAEIRDFIPVLADEAGIIWVEGFGIADRVKITDNTSKIWEIQTAAENNARL